MSAGPDAIPMWQENAKWKQNAKEPVQCYGCEWKGQAYDLLCEADSQTLWCPQCRSTNWVFR
jgi:hypothetical protein